MPVQSIVGCDWDTEKECFAYELESPILFDSALENIKGSQVLFWGATDETKKEAFTKAWAIINDGDEPTPPTPPSPPSDDVLKEISQKQREAKSVWMEVTQIDSNTYVVVNPENKNHYVVRPNHPELTERCECGDTHYRGAECKHQIAVKNWLKLQTKEVETPVSKASNALVQSGECSIEDCNETDENGQRFVFRIQEQLVGYIWLSDSGNWDNWDEFWVNGRGDKFKTWQECGNALAKITAKHLYQMVSVTSMAHQFNTEDETDDETDDGLFCTEEYQGYTIEIYKQRGDDDFIYQSKVPTLNWESDWRCYESLVQASAEEAINQSLEFQKDKAEAINHSEIIAAAGEYTLYEDGVIMRRGQLLTWEDISSNVQYLLRKRSQVSEQLFNYVVKKVNEFDDRCRLDGQNKLIVKRVGTDIDCFIYGGERFNTQNFEQAIFYLNSKGFTPTQQREYGSKRVSNIYFGKVSDEFKAFSQITRQHRLYQLNKADSFAISA
jgi:hypothetical protein